MDGILAYIREQYHPDAIIVYGSYSSQTNNENSDFDALVICTQGEKWHDTSFVDGVQLDVFIYSRAYLAQLDSMEEIVQIWDGVIVEDTDGIAAHIKEAVNSYICQKPVLTLEEKDDLISWCRKMLSRTVRKDAEGLYRWHWLLTDSLSIYCQLRGLYYFGPKKTLLRMQKDDPEGYSLYIDAMTKIEGTAVWIEHAAKWN